MVLLGKPSLVQLWFSFHRLFVHLKDDLLPFCEKDYCWETPAVFAVYRPNATKALKLCSSKREANDYIKFKNLTGDIRIQERPTTRRRCEKYCKVSQFCNQYKEWLAKNSPQKEETEAAQASEVL